MNNNTHNLALSSILGMVITIASSTQAETLNEVVQRTLATNPEVQASMQLRNAREQEIRIARSDYYPEVFISAGIGDENTDSPYTRSLSTSGDSVDLTRREVAFVVRQSLYSGFNTTENVASAQARMDAASSQVTSTSERIILRTSQAYLAVMRDKAQLQLANDNLLQHKDIYEKVKQRSERGVGRKADLMQVEGRVALAESHVISADANYLNTIVNYRRVVGAMPAEDMQMPASFAEALPVNLQEAQDLVLKNNPDVQIATANVMAANAQYKATRSSYHPQLDLVFEQTWDDNLDGVEGENEGYSIMLKLRYNLFNGGSDMARNKQTAFLVNQSKAQQELTQRAVSEELNLAWTTYKALRRQLIFLKQHVDASVQTLDAYNKQFNLGQRTLLDLLDAHNELFEANRAYTAAQFDSIYQQYRILANLNQLQTQLNNRATQ